MKYGQVHANRLKFHFDFRVAKDEAEPHPTVKCSDLQNEGRPARRVILFENRAWMETGIDKNSTSRFQRIAIGDGAIGMYRRILHLHFNIWCEYIFMKKSVFFIASDGSDG